MQQIVEWIVGASFLFVHALSRFNTPPSNRSTTTRWRYYCAAISYFLALFLLFVLFTGVLTTLEAQPTTTDGGSVDGQPSHLPSALLSALFLIVMVPNSPVLSKFDDWLYQRFKDMGSIPWIARRLSGRLRRARILPPPRLHDEIRRSLAGFDDADIRLHDDGSAQFRWTALTGLYLHISAWRESKRYDRFMESSRDEYQRVRVSYERLRPKAQNCFRFQREALDENGPLSAIAECQANLEEQMDELFKMMCDFIARAVLRCERRRADRDEVLEELGFKGLSEETEPLNADQVVAVGMMTFVIMLIGFAVTGRLMDMRKGLFIASMVATIYPVALVSAIHPKTLWKFANIRKTNHRPVRAYMLSGCLAVLLGVIIATTFKFVWYGDFLDAVYDIRWSYPWSALSFVLAFGTAYLADDFFSKDTRTEPAWGRWAEGLTLACGMLLTSVFVQHLLSVIPDLPEDRIPNFVGSAAIATSIGFFIGVTIPRWYRQTATGSQGTEASYDVGLVSTPQRAHDPVGGAHRTPEGARPS